MTGALSPRLAAIAGALPLRAGLRVLEIGCGPGALARAIAARVPGGAILATDRSARAIAAAEAGPPMAGLRFHLVDARDLRLEPGEAPYDIAVAIRVGALDGRHPDEAADAIAAIRAMLVPDGRLFIDGGDPLCELPLGR